MKIDNALFTFRDRVHGLIHVEFCFDDKGIAVAVVINAQDKSFSFDNAKGTWKPCVTHCQDLIRLAFGRQPRTKFAKQKIKHTRPNLRVVSA